MSQFQIAVILMLGAVVAVLGFRKFKLIASKHRLTRMLSRVGLDPDLADQGDADAIIKEVRKRCSRCQTEDLCERWLADKAAGGNEFCPNAKVFEKLKQV